MISATKNIKDNPVKIKSRKRTYFPFTPNENDWHKLIAQVTNETWKKQNTSLSYTP